MITISEPQATVWFEDERPARLIWNGKRWYVLDIPTRIGGRNNFTFPPVVTHPPQPWIGWRFIARTDDDSDTYVFDIKEARPDQWEVLRVIS